MLYKLRSLYTYDRHICKKTVLILTKYYGASLD